MTKNKRNQRKSELNQTARDYSHHKCLHELFELQVTRTPDAIAVTFEEQGISYSELNERANQIAHRLIALDVGPETLVGICVERSIEMIAGILGILKAGGAYVPLDPTYPKERLGFMLDDAGLSLLLTQQSLLERLPDNKAQLVLIDGDADYAHESTENPAKGVTVANLAYVIYTSGSTGRPKGVLVTHANVVRLFTTTKDWFNFGPQDVWTLFHSYAFDFSVWEFWGALLHGGRLVVVPYLVSRTPEAFYELLRREKVTVLNQTPSAFRQLMRAEANSIEDELSLRLVIFGGEALQISTLRGWFERHGHQRPQLVNMYGITETTVHVTYRPLRTEDVEAGSVIGVPIPDLQVHVLDENRQPVATGVAGELYVGGPGVARGYLNRPELTAERFIPDPFSSNQEARLYRTGDLVRQLAVDDFEYVGRCDQQVKIRGFRIELGEIEAVLREHELINECVVVTSEMNGDQRLVAYVTLTNGHTTSVAQLRGWLQGRVPEYMVPATFVLLGELPLTANGKVDRLNLPVPTAGRLLDNDFVAARTPTEALLTNIWSDVLRIETIGVEDNFFDLGGHSILVAQVASRIRDCCKVELPQRSVFENPTIARLSRIIDTNGLKKSSQQLATIPRSERRDVVPLSLQQEQIWFIQQLHPESRSYHSQSTLSFSGTLDYEALSQALGEIIRRHEILRTTFDSVDGRPMQIIHPPHPVSLPVVDLRSLPATELQAATERLISNELQRKFEVSKGPLIRWLLVRVAPDQHLLVHLEHHLVHDGWSFNLFIGELIALYTAFSLRQPSSLTELPIQYADYTYWQRRWLEGDEARAQLAYWTSKLRNCPRALELPSDRPRQAIQSFHGSEQRIELPAQLCEALKTRSREENATLFMTLFATFLALLHRYTGADDICVGSGAGNRCWREVEGLIGMFVNTLVLRTDLSGDPTCKELLARVRSVMLEAYSHQSIPFNHVVEVLQPDRDLSRNPLFQVAFSFHDAPRPKLKVPGLNIGVTEALNNGSAKFDLNIIVIREPLPKDPDSTASTTGGMTMIWEYNTDLFNPTTIARMMTHYERLLGSLAQTSDRRLSQLPMMDSVECQQLLSLNNRTRREYPGELSVSELFERQVERTPDNTAVTCGDERVTYRELNERANRLARYLRQSGVEREALVGVMLPRSIDVVVALLAVLKAGAAYVPFDAENPDERLRLMASDAGLKVVLTEKSLLERARNFAEIVACLDIDATTIEKQDCSNLHCGSTGQSLAYVMYTSGSTGKPKGICIEHHSINRLVINTDYVQLTTADRVAQVSNISFDAATFEIWGALLNGASVVIVSKDVALTPHEFAAEIRDKQISTLFLTTALFNQLARALPSAFSSLRYLLFGGESVDPHWVAEVLKNGRPEHLLHVYGPTETTTFASWYEVERIDESDTTVPIGRPLANTTLYVLDKRGEIVPSGVWGELYIGGEGVGRGYLNQPELTAERFIPDPFQPSTNARLYRTGDIVRQRGDGAIEFVGRKDQQIKLRGFRIELSEIESALRLHKAISECVVVLREDTPGDRRLTAYFVSHNPEGAPSASDLRSYLKHTLPEYMVPAAFVQLDEMPLSPNGKIETQQLPPPEGEAPRRSNILSSQSPTEELLMNLWAEVLNVSEIGLDDDFFGLGGHSLMATRVISRIRECFNVELPLRDLFEEPTIGGLSGRIEAARRSTSPILMPALVPVVRENNLPLSYAQQRLWFLDQLEPQNTAYNIAGGFWLRGRVDNWAVESSLREIIKRHEVLRTSFPLVNGRPVQSINDADALFELTYHELQSLSLPEFERETTQLIKEEGQRPFNLETGPLLRVSLLTHTDERHVLLLGMHHIVSDGWSLNLLLNEFAVLYQSFVTRQPYPLPELPVQYVDYAVGQREWLEAGVMEERLTYWRKQLDGLTTLQLPTDRMRPPVQTFRGRRVVTNLSTELTGGLKRLSQRQGTTLFMTLLASFNVLLARYTGQNDITVGSPIAGRDRRELEELIGFFVNTLVLRTDLSGDPTFHELLQLVREVTLEAYAHQEVPFERLVEELQPRRDLSRSPLFQVTFSLLNMPTPELRAGELELERVELYNDLAKFDLSLTASEAGNRLELALQYNIDLFDETTVARLMSHFERLLEAVVSNPERRISAMPLLSVAERQQLLTEWNNTSSDYPRERSIQSLFEEQAQLTPDAIALESGDRRLTYGELNKQANQLAHYLKRFGVGEGTKEPLVGVMLGRSIELIVTLLGVLKAGAAYLPFDPDYPTERLKFMLEDAAVQVLITEDRLADRLTDAGSRVICLDREAQSISSEIVTNPDADVTARSLAYVMYTSGSKGQPKGICIEHRSVVRLVRNTNYVRLNSDEVMLQFAPVSFDASTFEVWGALLNGSRLVIVENDRASLVELSRTLQEKGVTTLWLTAGLFHLMVDEHIEGLRGIRQLLAGGDVLSVRHVKRVLDELPECRLINGYGPTENTTFTCCHVMEQRADLGVSVPIGKPISNTRVYVLNERMEPVPLGVAGELYVGGDGVGRGYLNQPEMTAERFIKDPFNQSGDARLYRTGDIVRWRLNGDLEFIGRKDDQVKLRGFRIELREIESALGRHPVVSECVVVLRDDDPGGKRLVAYFVAAKKQGAVPDASELRQYLKQSLPEYMVPSGFVSIQKMPLTANGKVDVQQLPSAVDVLPPGHEYHPASTPAEELLLNIWADVLNITGFGVTDDFFELGGHSLLATQVVSRIREYFHIELPLRDLFEEPTIAGLSQRVEAARDLESPAKTAPITPANRGLLLPLSFAQQRLWFLDQLEPQNIAYNITGAIRLTGPVDAAAVQHSLTAIVRRHEILRTSFPIINGRPVQQIADLGDEVFPLECRHLTSLGQVERDAKLQRLIAEEAQLPFDLAHGPMIRVALLSLSAEEHVLLLTTHHIVSDGWSLNTFFKEFAAFYQEHLSGNQPAATPLPFQYADYAIWQRDSRHAEELERKIEYWRTHLRGLATLQLPTDRQRPPVQTFNGGCVTTTLGSRLTEKLRELDQHEGTTLFMTLLAAFDVLLARYSGQDDIVVGSPIAGRNRRELEDLIGFFVNTVVLRTDLGGDPTFRDLLRLVRDLTLDAYAHQDVPFERLVEELQPRRDLSRSPLFQVMFGLVNVPSDQIRIAGIEVEEIKTNGDTSKFDLSLTGKEVGDQIDLAIHYNSDLFDAATVTQMLKHYERLLEAIVADPQQRVSELELLTEDERKYLELEVNRTHQYYPANVSVATLFEQQVERTADQIAVACGEEHLTYRELNERANQLASYLMQRGVGPDVLVGVLLDRSVETIVSLLGVLKAGGGYVPLDPEFPGERLEFMLRDAGVKVLITKGNLAASLSLPSMMEVVNLTSDRDRLELESATNPDFTHRSESLAYVIYTSGSTGKPKGVMVEHRSLVNLLTCMQQEFGLIETDVLVAVTTLSFDIAQLDVYLPLLSGAKTVLARREEILDAQKLRQLVERSRATMMQATPTLWRMLVDTGWEGIANFKALCGGEVLTRELAGQLLDRSDALWNGYGPTETTIYSTVHRVNPAEVVRRGATIPLGRPIANTQCYVVDKNMSLVPPGVPGELLIGGDGLARGYLNRAELTAERFIEHGFRDQLKRKLYRTGDCVRIRATGEIEYLGRLDQQVKIRGYRIEVGEIEAVLAEHQDIQQAAVVVREDVAGDKRLVSYVIPAKVTKSARNGNGRGTKHSTASWRNYLLGRLPEYMVPSIFVTLEELPLTASGKVDYKLLPTPNVERESIVDSQFAPQNEAEQTIAEIWQGILRIDHVGRYDNFFDLGGNSLLMAQVQNRLQAAFKRDVAMVDLFRYPTINCLGEYLSQASPSQPISNEALRRADIRLQAGRKNAQPKEN